MSNLLLLSLCNSQLVLAILRHRKVPAEVAQDEKHLKVIRLCSKKSLTRPD